MNGCFSGGICSFHPFSFLMGFLHPEGWDSNKFLKFSLWCIASRVHQFSYVACCLERNFRMLAYMSGSMGALALWTFTIFTRTLYTTKDCKYTYSYQYHLPLATPYKQTFQQWVCCLLFAIHAESVLNPFWISILNRLFSLGGVTPLASWWTSRGFQPHTHNGSPHPSLVSQNLGMPRQC